MGAVFWVSWLRLTWSNQTKKSGILVNSLSYVEDPGRQGRALIPRAFMGIISGAYIYLWRFPMACVGRRSCVCSRPLQAAWPHKCLPSCQGSNAVVKDSRNIRRMETTAIYPGRYEWMEMMTQMRGPRNSEELILHHMVLEDLLQWKWFSGTWVCVCYCHRNVSPAPFCLLNHSWICHQWLFVSITVWTKSLLLACDKLHSSVAFRFLGDPRKTLPISE